MKHPTIFKYIASSLMTSLLASIILFLTSPPQSYILFVLFFLLSATITPTIMGKNFVIKLPIGHTNELNLFLIFTSLTLLILQFTNIHNETINTILYVILFIFAPGYFILNMIKFKPTFSRIELAALLYPVSLAFIAIVGTIALLLPASSRPVFALLVITSISIISFYRSTKNKQTKVNNHPKLTIKNNDILLVIILLIFIYFFMELYPAIASFPQLDISRNFLQARAFTKNTLGDFYSVSTLYPLFGICQSYVVYITNPTIEVFQSISIFLNLFIILTFYAMASEYLKKFSRYAPTLATLIWTTFAGFGWLNFITQKIANPNTALLSLIGQTNGFSYGDITWRRLFFSLSMETSLVLVFAILYFLKRTDMSRTKQLFVLTLLLTPLPLMHQYAIYLLLPLLICLTIFQSSELKHHTKYTAYSLTLSAFVSLLLNYCVSTQIGTTSIGYVPILGYLLTSLAIIFLTSLQKRTRYNLKLMSEQILNSKYTFLATSILLVMFFVSVFLWFSGNLSFNFGALNIFGYVPWFLYPVKLGLTGILVIATMLMVLKCPIYRSRELGTVIAAFLLLFFSSRLLAMFQMHYVSTFTFYPNSWLSEIIRQNILSFREERMFELIKIPLAIIASMAFGKYIVIKSKQKNFHISNYLIVSGIISLILISGMASTLLGFEYYYKQTQSNPLSSSELNIINNMQNRIYANGKSIIISPQTPNPYLDFTGATTIVTESTAALTSKSPELPLFVTRYSKTTPTYIYLHKTRDFPKLNDYAENYLEHLANVTPTYLENQEVQIKEIKNTSIPIPHSTTALIIPYDLSSMETVKPFFQEESNQYIVAALFFDENLQFHNFYNEPINYTNVQLNEEAHFNGIDSYIRINGTQTNFNKILIEFAYQPLNLTRNQVIASKLDWGNPPQKSWEIAQYGNKIVFKVSPDGTKEEVLQTPEMLQLNEEYAVSCEYDGTSMKILINNKLLATKSYQNGIFETNTDIIIGAELRNDDPTAYASMLLKYIRILNDIPPVTEPIFNAYDLLSFTGLYYTTILSTDNYMGTYETLILPYDDTITSEILARLKAEENSTKTLNIVIINANGYGPLLNIFGNKSTETFTADKILADQHLPMKTPINVVKIDLNKNTHVEAQYINNDFSSPLIMTTKQDQLTLIYVNIFPLLSQNQLLDSTTLQTLTKSLNNYIAPYNETIITPWFSEPSLLFTKLQASGEITLQSNSIISPNIPENQTLNLNQNDTFIIKSNSITIQNGYGFYTTLIASNPSITLQNNQTTSIKLTGNITLLIRQPEISVNGKIHFENFHMLHPPTIYTDGRNTTLGGNITLNIYISDEYTIALPYKLNSPITVTYEKPLMEFNELSSLISTIPYIILILIFMIPLIITRQTQTSNNKETLEAKRETPF